eukprot:CAMPEP_0206155768 /NCGR_PEP_ID=MMETSP1474-20131121/2375_1 /ASSEMBLY_ACC=CAM_ASM_001110 /TAXON_ID=97495 /ORGANISM="Imantonia sp., Strain RCC918" /LENGTH=537 /DNA_ID=CAMNT_0053554537 /DNA_START=50 /DNA_END=1660 /DNA_ORIENTATION=-
MSDPAQTEASSGGQVDTTASRPLESKREASSTSVNEASMMSYVEPSMLALAADEPEVKMKPAVSLGELRRFQTGGDYLLMALAALAAVGGGVVQITLLLFFEDFLDAGGDSQAAGGRIELSTVYAMCVRFALTGVAVLGLNATMICCGNLSAARQKARLKKALLQSVLRQDVGWFDIANPQMLAPKMVEAFELISKGIDGPNFMVFQGVGMLITGITIAFLRAPDVAGVVLACSPLLAAAMMYMGYVLLRTSRVRLRAYSGAGGLATDVLYSMRTVASLGAERMFSDRFEAILDLTAKDDWRQSFSAGFSTACAFSCFLLLQAVGYLYGGVMYANEIRDSGFDYVVPTTAEVASSPALINTSSVYCASADNSLAYIAVNTSCRPPYVPWLMTCQIAEYYSELPFLTAGNLTALQLLQQPSFTALRDFALEQTPGYAASNPEYYPCLRDAAVVLVAVFAIVQGANGLGIAAQPYSNLAKAKAALSEVYPILCRSSPIDAFAAGGIKLGEGAGSGPVRGEVEVRDVTFAYPSAPQHLVC